MKEIQVLAVESLQVTYPEFELRPLSFQVEAGQSVALVGANGAGKTTLLSRLAAQTDDYSGSIRLDGQRYGRDLASIRASVGYVPHEFVGYGWMSVSKHLRFLSNFYPNWRTELAERLCEVMDLDPDSKLATLSRGSRLKLAFVSAEAYRPPLMILDEPTAGLDPVVRKSFLEFVAESFGPSTGRVLVFSTHILEDVEWIADRVMALDDGDLVADCPLSELRDLGGSMPRQILALLES